MCGDGAVMLLLPYMKKRKFDTTKMLVIFLCFICLGIGYALSFLPRAKHLFVKPLVSVVISTYNRADFLPRAIDSIRYQTMGNWELILINDGSTDETANILKAYERLDPRIKVLTNKKNSGLIYSLNRGLNAARGKFIARMDDDDKSLPDRLARQVAFMEKEQLDLCSAVMNINDKPTARYFYLDKDSSDLLSIKLFFGNIFAHPSIMLRKSFIDQYNIRYDNEHPNAEDYEFWAQMVLHHAKLGVLGGGPIVTYNYGSHGGDYYSKMGESVKKTQLKLLKRVVPNIQRKDLKLTTCDLLEKMIAENKIINFLNQTELTAFEHKECLFKHDKMVYRLSHPNYTDYFIPTKTPNYYTRKNVSDAGTITPAEDNDIIIDWDNWGVEYFSCDTEKKCVFKKEIK